MDRDTIDLLGRTFEDAIYPGEFLRQYEMLECLFSSGENETLLVRDRGTGDRCIAKCSFRDSPLFSKEIPPALREIRHPPLPRFVAEFTNDQVRCILWEYIPGQTLEEHRASHALGEEEVLRIALQLCEQLEYLHSLTPPVIHRDIKPQNVILREDGIAALIDFGISRPCDKEESAETITFGTRGFAPPEQYGFAQADARSDLYSLGVLMQWLLHGTTTGTHRPETPLEKVVAKCMSFDPQKRYPSAAALRRALHRARSRSRIIRRSGMAAALLALLFCGTALLLPGRERAVNAEREMASLGFRDETIYRAARACADLRGRSRLTAARLREIEGIYIVGNKVFTTPDKFYNGIQTWYREGQLPGTIKSLDDLALLPNLKEVCMVGQEFSDISVLSGLRELEKLEIKHNRVTDIGALSDLPCLVSVGINGNPVQDLSPLLTCPELRYLDLCDVHGYDPSVLAQLGSFTFLDISNRTDSYRYLSGKTIPYLKLAWTSIEDLSCLDGVSGIEELEINGSGVTDLTPLLNHPELRVVKLTGLEVENAEVLTGLPRLEAVIVSSNTADALSALGELPFAVICE